MLMPSGSIFCRFFALTNYDSQGRWLSVPLPTPASPRLRVPQQGSQKGASDAKDASDTKRWTDNFPTADKETAVWRDRNKIQGGIECTPAPATMEKLPGIDTAADCNLILGPLQDLVPVFFFIMFPMMVFDYILQQTNAFFRHCTAVYSTTEEQRAHGQTDAHRKQTDTLGGAKVGPGGFTMNQLLGAVGITLMSGIMDLRRMKCHWSISPNYDFPRIRNCMSRDSYFLIYSRFFRMAPSPGPEPGDKEYDSKHHIRVVEEKLNTAWSTAMLKGLWISFEEQMAKRAAPFARGLKSWAACCVSGFCFVSCIDGGFTGDKILRQWANDPLGRTTRVVLWVLLGACEAFAEQLEGSGVHIAMGTYVTSPMLFGCLATHLIFAVGTLQTNQAGVAGAMARWAQDNVVLKAKGAMAFLRWGDMSVTQWIDNKKIFFLSTIHIFANHVEGQPYARRVKGPMGMKVGEALQPLCRLEYVKFVGGVDCAYQKGAAHKPNHRPTNYFWRRVFEHLLLQAVVNGNVLFTKWAKILLTRATARIEGFTRAGKDTKDLERVAARLKHFTTMERVKWDEALADHLISQCNEGNARGGGTRKRRMSTVAQMPGNWFRNAWAGPAPCFNQVKKRRLCNKTSRGMCGCDTCLVDGDSSRTRICKACCASPVDHAFAVAYAQTKTAKGTFKHEPKKLPPRK